MFSYIKGTYIGAGGDAAIVETGGVGWQIRVPVSVIERLPRPGEPVTLHTSFQVRDDAMTLYGFLEAKDREMFEELLGVSGVGPKAALGILSAMQPDALRLAVLTEDAAQIAKAPGIGPKTARRIILDLKDRISRDELLSGTGQTALTDAQPEAAALAGVAGEARAALTALGYSSAEALRAVKAVELKEGMTVEDVLRAALRRMNA